MGGHRCAAPVQGWQWHRCPQRAAVAETTQTALGELGWRGTWVQPCSQAKSITGAWDAPGCAATWSASLGRVGRIVLLSSSDNGPAPGQAVEGAVSCGT